MLKGIDPLLTPGLLLALAEAGHGDAFAVVSRNYAARSKGVPVVYLPGTDVTEALRAICTLLPLDAQLSDTPVRYMLTAGGAPGPAVEGVRAVLAAAEGRQVGMAGLERFAFYEASSHAVAIVQTGDARPYSCFLVTKGVV